MTVLMVRPAILGITDHYDPASSEVFDFSIPLSKLKLISFE